MKYQTFTVKTTFQFPIDMLRYDSCFPHSEKDAGEITDNLTNYTRAVKIEIGRYVTNKNTLPTISRWESFGCKVNNIATR